MTSLSAGGGSAPGVDRGRMMRGAAIVTGLVGFAVLTGWGLEISWLRSGFGSGRAVNPATAVLFVLAAVSLWISGLDRPAPWAHRLGITSAVGVLLTAGLLLAAPLLGLPSALDQSLFRSWLASLGANAPKPMSGGSAFFYLIIGAALLLIRSPREAWRLVGRSLGLLLALTGLLVLFTYAYRWLTGSGAPGASAGFGIILGFLALSLALTVPGGPKTESGGEDGNVGALSGKVNLALVVAVAILVLTGTMSIWATVRSWNANRSQAESTARRAQLVILLSSLQDAETGERGFLLTGNSEFLAPYQTALDSLPVALRRTEELLSHAPAQAQRLDTLQVLVGRQAAFLAEAIRLQQSRRSAEAISLVRSGRGKAVMDEIRRKISPMIVEEDSLNARLAARVLFGERISLSIVTLAGLLAVCFLLLAGLAINQDFRRRARAEAELDRFFAISLDMLCIANADGYFKRISPAFTETLGWAVEEMLGRPFLDFVHPEDQAATLREVERQTAAGKPVLGFENRYRHRDGSWRVLSWRSVPQPGGFMFATARDVTDAHAAEAALRSAKEAAEAANHAKSDFLAKMSHELRTPLNSIIGFSEILEDESVGPLTDKQRRYTSNVLVSGRNLLQLINDILDLSKVEAGRMELVPSLFEMRAALDQVRAIVGTLADRKGLTVELEIPASLPLLHADQAKFKQILYNLLGNAIKFTPEGGRVKVSARVINGSGSGASGEWLEIAVADTGIGIAAEHLTRIFKEFEQVNTDPSYSQQGTGLGLALTRNLVELHGGRVWVESEVGRGSVFRFTLPCAPLRPHPAEPAPSLPPGDTCDPAGPLVLVIDNDPAARDLITHYLAEGGYRVASAADGEEAIRLAEALRPDAITLDMLLPDRDGLLILAQLKTSPDTRSIPVLVVSVTDRRELGFSLGAAGWLVKPINKGELLTALHATTAGGARVGKPTVLVVDDEAATVAYLSELLHQRGFAVLAALGGEAGIALALARQPDVIILDLLMPEVNGFDVVRALRENSQAQEIPILILTAMDLTRADAERLGRSVQAIVSKGGPNELLAELARICPIPAPAPEPVAQAAL